MRPTRLAAALLVVSACTSAAPTPPASPAEQPVRGGVIVQPIAQDVTTLQPLLADDGNTIAVVELLYDVLWRPDPKSGEPRAHLASWRISEDARAYAWSIDPRAMWSDGRPIVAEDVLTAVKLLGVTRRSPPPHLADIEGLPEFMAGRSPAISGFVVDGQDPKRFSVRLQRPSCIVPLGPLQPLPTHVFGKYLAPSTGSPRDAFVSAAENDAPTVVSGPFLLEEWRRKESISFRSNTSYWRGAPLLDRYVIRVMPPARWPDELQAGRLDYVPFNITLRDSIPRLEKDPSLGFQNKLDTTYLAIIWNTQSRTAPALRDRRVRQALAYGLDIDVALRALRDGRGEKTLSHHVPGFWAATDVLNAYPYDPARARTLLEQAGWSMGASGWYERDGAPLAITIETTRGNPEREGLLQFAVDQYRLIGIRVTPVLRDGTQLIEQASTSDGHEALILGLLPPADGDPFRTWHSSQIADPAKGTRGGNASRFAHPVVDAAIEAARQGPDCSIATRKKHYETFNRVVNEEQPYRFAFVGHRITFTRAHLRGFEVGVYANDTYDVHRWWIAPEKK